MSILRFFYKKEHNTTEGTAKPKEEDMTVTEEPTVVGGVMTVAEEPTIVGGVSVTEYER